jgi:hypothetical protein
MIITFKTSGNKQVHEANGLMTRTRSLEQGEQEKG